MRRVTYEIVPMTLAYMPTTGRVVETPCTDEQAMEWYIYATMAGERKVWLHAMSRKIADAVVAMMERDEE